MSDSKKPNLEDMSIEELAALDLEADKTKDVNAGPLLKIKPLLAVKSTIRAGASIVGLARH